MRWNNVLPQYRHITKMILFLQKEQKDFDFDILILKIKSCYITKNMYFSITIVSCLPLNLKQSSLMPFLHFRRFMLEGCLYKSE